MIEIILLSRQPLLQLPIKDQKNYSISINHRYPIWKDKEIWHSLMIRFRKEIKTLRDITDTKMQPEKVISFPLAIF
jgi:hypothetical protein